MLWKLIACIQGKCWQLVSETAGNIQILWDFSFRQSKQGFRSVEKLSGVVYKGNQSYSLLIICLFPAIKLSLLYIQTPAFLPNRTDEDIFKPAATIHPSVLGGWQGTRSRFLLVPPPAAEVSVPLQRSNKRANWFLFLREFYFLFFTSCQAYRLVSIKRKCSGSSVQLPKPNQHKGAFE